MKRSKEGWVERGVAGSSTTICTWSALNYFKKKQRGMQQDQAK
jgi:hypothetical protein